MCSIPKVKSKRCRNASLSLWEIGFNTLLGIFFDLNFQQITPYFALVFSKVSNYRNIYCIFIRKSAFYFQVVYILELRSSWTLSLRLFEVIVKVKMHITSKIYSWHFIIRNMGNNKSLFIFVLEIELCDVDDYNIENVFWLFWRGKVWKLLPTAS